jgi:hypothetical protein
MAGLLAPEELIQKVLDDIEKGAVKTLQQLTDIFRSIHENYPAYEWSWVAKVIQDMLGKSIGKVTVNDLIGLVNGWQTAMITLDRMLCEDTRKEFEAVAQTGFGIDGPEGAVDADFSQVRGTFETNSFVADIEKHTAAKTALGEELLSRLNELK